MTHCGAWMHCLQSPVPPCLSCTTGPGPCRLRLVRMKREPAPVTYSRTLLSTGCQMPLSWSPSLPLGPRDTQGCGIPERPSPPGSQARGAKESLLKGGRQKHIFCTAHCRALRGKQFQGFRPLLHFPLRAQKCPVPSPVPRRCCKPSGWVSPHKLGCRAAQTLSLGINLNRSHTPGVSHVKTPSRLTIRMPSSNHH